MSIEALRALIGKLPEGTSHAALARAAAVHPNYIHMMLKGQKPVEAVMLGRLRFAAKRLTSGEGDGAAIVGLYRALIVVCAVELGEDPAVVQGTDPNSKQMRLPGWLARVFVHWVARHVMCDAFGLSQATVAQALGVTRQAVNKSVKQVLERVERDAVFEAQLDRILDKLLGGVS